jgi:predicted component of type VI protein secretion system
MFLRRKFPDPTRAATGPRDLVQEVVANLDLLLGTKRGIGHVLPDFGFSQSGHWSSEGLIAHYTAELRENVSRYEPRLHLLEVDGEMGEDGRPELVIEASVDGAEGVWKIVLDLGLGRVARVEPA